MAAMLLPVRHRSEAVHAFGGTRSLPMAVTAGIAAAFGGVCLVGTTFLTSPSSRSIRVFNRGGLDWDRPVYGQFGPFSGGMFGLLPVYCRAEGYEFGIIDKETIADTDLRGTQSLC